MNAETAAESKRPPAHPLVEFVRHIHNSFANSPCVCAFVLAQSLVGKRQTSTQHGEKDDTQTPNVERRPTKVRMPKAWVQTNFGATEQVRLQCRIPEAGKLHMRLAGRCQDSPFMGISLEHLGCNVAETTAVRDKVGAGSEESTETKICNFHNHLQTHATKKTFATTVKNIENYSMHSWELVLLLTFGLGEPEPSPSESCWGALHLSTSIHSQQHAPPTEKTWSVDPDNDAHIRRRVTKGTHMSKFSSFKSLWQTLWRCAYEMPSIIWSSNSSASSGGQRYSSNEDK